ncbi:hypothetical protein [Sphingomonas sp. S2-65]|uniref:hypothetical protein n=1 Tax=Sphingomonas sp. S2-65 TaxID=2903960 RepID=UPI001F18E679|nr:hypothetical protein [Sphingomonas sp. S2-65]UYY57756.1 hypothetical protein LZ586_13965 [Sphingomonas sp. S2-65]
MTQRAPSTFVRDAALALLLAAVLGAAWTIRDWSDLGALRLPDTDDAVRLLQVRDWLAGQAFGDVTQARIGIPPGLAMHWTRAADLGPAALIALLGPLIGGHAATVTAVTLWPITLFAVALALTGSISRALGSAAATAMAVAALAYPATTLFLPGRIDHHGLQIVLLLALVRAVLGTGKIATGALGGAATALSIAVGLETAPLLAVGGLAITAEWWHGRAGARERMTGYAAALALGLAGAALLFRTSAWSYPACDGFTATAWRAAQALSLGPLALAAASPLLRTRAARSAAVLLVAMAGLAVLWLLGQRCADPYGSVDPLVRRLWLAHVGEARPLLEAPVADAIGYAGLMTVGVVATLWQAIRTRAAGWVVLLAFQLGALAITLVQLRGAYAGAQLAAPALAATIAVARSRGVVALAASWLASAGFVYPLAGSIAAPAAGPPSGMENCTSPGELARLAKLPGGTAMTSIDIGAFAVVATPHRLVAAPYHRNMAGNAAMYRFFLSEPSASEAIARQLKIDYVVSCPSDFAELGRSAGVDTLARQLQVGHAPAWLAPVGGPGPLRIYRVTR